MTMKKIYFILFITVLTSSCEEVIYNNPQSVYDMTEFLSEYKSANPQLTSAQLITETHISKDTIIYETYAVDSLINMMSNFNFTTRERSGEFDIKEKKEGKKSCTTYIPQDEDVAVQKLNVCKTGESISELSGEKDKNSILNRLSQSYRFQPDGIFVLKSTFIDKVRKDTLRTQNTLTWN